MRLFSWHEASVECGLAQNGFPKRIGRSRTAQEAD